MVRTFAIVTAAMAALTACSSSSPLAGAPTCTFTFSDFSSTATARCEVRADADQTCYDAALCVCRHWLPAGTADLGITYLRPAVGERIFAAAEVVKRGRQLSLVEVTITNEQDTLLARGRVLYAFRPGA